MFVVDSGICFVVQFFRTFAQRGAGDQKNARLVVLSSLAPKNGEHCMDNSIYIMSNPSFDIRNASGWSEFFNDPSRNSYNVASISYSHVGVSVIGVVISQSAPVNPTGFNSTALAHVHELRNYGDRI